MFIRNLRIFVKERSNDRMKKEYESIECSIIYFDNEDIVTTSGLTKNTVNADSPAADIDFAKHFLS